MDRQAQATAIIAPHFEAALRECASAGIPLEEAVLVLLQVSCGAMNGVLPPGVAQKTILRLRDEIFAELTLSAERRSQ